MKEQWLQTLAKYLHPYSARRVAGGSSGDMDLGVLAFYFSSWLNFSHKVCMLERNVIRISQERCPSQTATIWGHF